VYGCFGKTSKNRKEINKGSAGFWKDTGVSGAEDDFIRLSERGTATATQKYIADIGGQVLGLLCVIERAGGVMRKIEGKGTGGELCL
jgi:hypothetical protein